LKFTIGKAYSFNMKYGLEKCMENWLERVWKPIEIFGMGYEPLA